MSKEITGDFADLFREAKRKKEITFREISKYTGLSISYLCDIEHRRRCAPSLEIVRKIEEVLWIDDGRLVKAASEERHNPSRAILEERVKKLKIALADAIRAPMGVIPVSAEGLLTQEELDAAEARRARTDRMPSLKKV